MRQGNAYGPSSNKLLLIISQVTKKNICFVNSFSSNNYEQLIEYSNATYYVLDDTINNARMMGNDLPKFSFEKHAHVFEFITRFTD